MRLNNLLMLLVYHRLLCYDEAMKTTIQSTGRVPKPWRIIGTILAVPFTIAAILLTITWVFIMAASNTTTEGGISTVVHSMDFEKVLSSDPQLENTIASLARDAGVDTGEMMGFVNSEPVKDAIAEMVTEAVLPKLNGEKINLTPDDLTRIFDSTVSEAQNRGVLVLPTTVSLEEMRGAVVSHGAEIIDEINRIDPTEVLARSGTTMEQITERVPLASLVINESGTVDFKQFFNTMTVILVGLAIIVLAGLVSLCRWRWTSGMITLGASFIVGGAFWIIANIGLDVLLGFVPKGGEAAGYITDAVMQFIMLPSIILLILGIALCVGSKLLNNKLYPKQPEKTKKPAKKK